MTDPRTTPLLAAAAGEVRSRLAALKPDEFRLKNAVGTAAAADIGPHAAELLRPEPTPDGFGVDAHARRDFFDGQHLVLFGHPVKCSDVWRHVDKCSTNPSLRVAPCRIMWYTVVMKRTADSLGSSKMRTALVTAEIRRATDKAAWCERQGLPELAARYRGYAQRLFPTPPITKHDPDVCGQCAEEAYR